MEKQRKKTRIDYVTALLSSVIILVDLALVGGAIHLLVKFIKWAWML